VADKQLVSKKEFMFLTFENVFISIESPTLFLSAVLRKLNLVPFLSLVCEKNGWKWVKRHSVDKSRHDGTWTVLSFERL